ncbi:hypothetical protein [Endozoicomonas euniceicola]|uniref:Uncharacterized protein n=1 Tax=Endozoicomonas euniceicola TaxID=1234143 RepID=A0ABY6GSD4_9GAMM|nr:hypothetical protein [Endozoicomonas euniceicola]UYM15665.1 hypothetical protein NX720_23000 [Endozoicomonas euniceicola]
MAMKGRHWNHSTGRPEPRLVDFLENQMLSIQQRLLESTSQRIPKPVYYSAAYNYNTDALMDHIIRHMPKKRRPKI